MLTLLVLCPGLAWSLAQPAFAEPERCSRDAVPRTRIIFATAPWRDGTLIAEECMADPGRPSTGDSQRLRFTRNDGVTLWTRPLGAQDTTGEVWWDSAEMIAQDVDGDPREEVIVRGELSNCGAGGCIAGRAALYIWPDLPDSGGDCGRRGFEEGQRGRLLTWTSARFDVPGWPGPSWVRSSLDRVAPHDLVVDETWTALPPAAHDPVNYTAHVTVGTFGLNPRCPTNGAPGL